MYVKTLNKKRKKKKDDWFQDMKKISIFFPSLI